MLITSQYLARHGMSQTLSSKQKCVHERWDGIDCIFIQLEDVNCRMDFLAKVIVLESEYISISNADIYWDQGDDKVFPLGLNILYINPSFSY